MAEVSPLHHSLSFCFLSFPLFSFLPFFLSFSQEESPPFLQSRGGTERSHLQLLSRLHRLKGHICAELLLLIDGGTAPKTVTGSVQSGICHLIEHVGLGFKTQLGGVVAFRQDSDKSNIIIEQEKKRKHYVQKSLKRQKIYISSVDFL